MNKDCTNLTRGVSVTIGMYYKTIGIEMLTCCDDKLKFIVAA